MVGGDFWDWVTSARTGSAASVFGVILTAIGFAVTLWNVYGSRVASERAEQAALEAREAARLFDTVQELTSALSALEEIKRLHREHSWPALPERYSGLKMRLITIRQANISLSTEHSSKLQGAISYLSDMENTVERSLDENEKIERIARFNERASDHMAQLQELLVDIRRQSGTM